MHRLLGSMSFLLVASACLAGPVPKAIQAEYGRVEQAFKKADVKALKTFFAPNFVSVDATGKKTEYKAMMAELDRLFAGAVSGSASEKLGGAKVIGETVEVQFDLKFTIKTAKGTSVGREIGTDTWKKVGGRWLFVKTVDKSFDVKPG